jgi:hypothetical protein
MSDDTWLRYRPEINDRADNYHVLWVEEGPAAMVGGLIVGGDPKFWKCTMREWRDFCRAATLFGNYTPEAPEPKLDFSISEETAGKLEDLDRKAKKSWWW